MRKAILFTTCLAISVLVLAGTPQQPLNVKPGLWQIDRTTKYSGLPPDMQAMLDRLTAQQRAAMGFGATVTYKSCVTEKQLTTTWVQGDENCTWTVLKSTSADLVVQGTSCQAGRDEGLTTNVEIKIHVVDAGHVQGSMHGTATGNGTNATLDGNYSGKWISPTCHGE